MTTATPEPQQFHLGDMLSITDGHLVSPNHMDGVYRIIDYITGIPHFTHQLPRAADECKTWLLKQHPWLAEVIAPDEFRDKAHVDEWLAALASKYGEFHPVAPMPFGAYVGREPLSELVEMVGKDRVIAVTIPPAL